MRPLMLALMWFAIAAFATGPVVAGPNAADEKRARELFLAARDDAAASNCDAAIPKLDEAARLLGGTNQF